MPQLGLLQRRRVLDQEHQAADQHLGVTSLGLNLANRILQTLNSLFVVLFVWTHLKSIDEKVDDSRPEMIEVCERDIPVSARHQLLDRHVGEVERQRQQRLQQVDGAAPQVPAVY